MSPKDTPSGAGIPVHQKVYEALRAQVLFGDLPPGAAVTIQGLADALGAGLTPVREALRRLIAAGALQMQDNRRISVPVLSADALAEIAHLRLAVEPELARRAAANVQPSDLVALKDIDAQIDAALREGDVPQYLIGNHAFHQQINILAQAPILADVAEDLWLRFGPAMRVICSAQGTQGLPDMHEDVLRALEQGDAHAAAQAMEADVTQGMQLLTAALELDPA